MFSVSPQLFSTLFTGARWLFAFFALMILLFALSWHHREQKKHRVRFRSLPGAGTVGEMVVISGDRQLAQDTWFPVPREGVLGSLRTCDLVIPCPGVRPHHLDFTWQDGVGLLLRPRRGCTVLVNGEPLEDAADAASTPLIHGSYLQIGSAVLRLQLFAALDHTGRVLNAAPVPEPFVSGMAAADPYAAVPPAGSQAAYPVYPPAPMPYGPGAEPTAPFPAQMPGTGFVPPQEMPPAMQPTAPDLTGSAPEQLAAPAPARRRRADRWKEDWSE